MKQGKLNRKNLKIGMKYWNVLRGILLAVPVQILLREYFLILSKHLSSWDIVLKKCDFEKKKTIFRPGKGIGPLKKIGLKFQKGIGPIWAWLIFIFYLSWIECPRYISVI